MGEWSDVLPAGHHHKRCFKNPRQVFDSLRSACGTMLVHGRLSGKITLRYDLSCEQRSVQRMNLACALESAGAAHVRVRIRDQPT